MKRPEIHCVIPVERESEQLDKTVDLLRENTKHFCLSVLKRPDLNVSEARQLAMDSLDDRYICFLDYDSEMVTPGWLDMMFETMQSNEAGVVFGREMWGTESRDIFFGSLDCDTPIDRGPAACMLIDRKKVPDSVKWNTRIGLRNGWLGGDFEEVEYAYQLQSKGVTCWLSSSAVFHHTGGRTTMKDFRKTDRNMTASIMAYLLDFFFAKCPDDLDFFKGLKYVKADPSNDLMLAPGSTLREAYHEVFRRNGLLNRPIAEKFAIT